MPGTAVRTGDMSVSKTNPLLLFRKLVLKVKRKPLPLPKPKAKESP